MSSTINSDERAATPRGTGAASTINTETIPHCRRSGQGVSRLEFFAELDGRAGSHHSRARDIARAAKLEGVAT